MWPQTVNTVHQVEENVMELIQKETRADVILTSHFRLWNEHTVNWKLRQMKSYQQIYQQNMKIMIKKSEPYTRILEIHQCLGNYLDNRGMKRNLKMRRNNIQFVYQNCNLVELQDQLMQFGNDSKLGHNVFSRELWHNCSKNIMVSSVN